MTFIILNYSLHFISRLTKTYFLHYHYYLLLFIIIYHFLMFVYIFSSRCGLLKEQQDWSPAVEHKGAPPDHSDLKEVAERD